ncbi:MAG: hypothetical protein ACI8PZ_003429 [Myxococcota bacterium]|jgi:hypothetical protein
MSTGSDVRWWRICEALGRAVSGRPQGSTGAGRADTGLPTAVASQLSVDRGVLALLEGVSPVPNPVDLSTPLAIDVQFLQPPAAD